MKQVLEAGILGCLFMGNILLAGQDQEQKLTPSSVPKAVTAAAAQRYPKARISGWSKEVEDGRTTYEASVQDGSSKCDIVLAADGSLVAIEQAVSISDLPASVMSTVQAKYPKASITKAEKISHDSAVQYEVTLRNAVKKEVLLTSQGQIVKEE